MGMIEIDPGGLTARLALQAPVTVPDGQGGAAIGFEVLALIWARIEPRLVTVTEQAGAETVTVTHDIWIRQRAGVAAGMRFVKGGRIFAVKAVHDPDETGRYLVCRCEEEGR
ncbi:phage head closure protein [Agrobacterium sp. a22-2]|uniref:phage head closure protein n=1 Tax=Agrobacterium sp. a22-2 TaxID=2283840 RepID=UPI0014451DDD|nr:phage head closure protein [Agrobacterium sp. a22-2]NKN39617.1 phage head closure protein [Agrobacterium sp. a22-2]